MQAIKEWTGVVAAIALFGGFMWFMWTFKWWVLGALIVYVVLVIGVNAVYKRIMGKDMAWYTRIMEEGKK